MPKGNQMSNLKEDIQSKYTDAYGLVNPDPCLPTDIDNTGNGLLYTGVYYLQLQKQGLIDSSDRKKLINIVSICFAKPGLLNRSPTKLDLQAFDDYYGITAAAKVLGLTDVTHPIHFYGQNNTFLTFRWSYDNQKPFTFTFRSWFGRFPWFPAHIQWSADERPNLFRRILWSLKILKGSSGTHPNARLLEWCMIQAVGECSLSKFAIKRWWNGVNKLFPGGMKEVIFKYFDHDHPLVQHWVD